MVISRSWRPDEESVYSVRFIHTQKTNKQTNTPRLKAGETSLKIHYHKYSLPNNVEEKTGNMKYIFVFFSLFSKLFYQKQRWHHEVTDTEAVNGAEGTSQGWEGSRSLGERLLGWFGCWFLCSVELFSVRSALATSGERGTVTEICWSLSLAPCKRWSPWGWRVLFSGGYTAVTSWTGPSIRPENLPNSPTPDDKTQSSY